MASVRSICAAKLFFNFFEKNLPGIAFLRFEADMILFNTFSGKGAGHRYGRDVCTTPQAEYL